MNILIINHYAGSPRHGMQYRHYYLAKEWQKQGHKAGIIAASFSHLRSSQPTLKGSLTEEEIEGICYFWLKTPRYRGNGIKRVMNMAAFALSLFTINTKLFSDRKPDLVIASSPHPFVLFGARKIARAFGARLFFEVRDLWPLTLTELGGISPRNPFISVMQKTEDIAYRISDKVISLLPRAFDYMKEHGLDIDRFAYIPNGVDAEEWHNELSSISSGDHVRALSDMEKDGKLIVGYAGAHGLANELYTFIHAAAMLKSLPVVFVLVGQGPEKEKLRQEARKRELGNVIFLDTVDRSTVPGLLNSMDILYIGLKNEPLFRFGISPNKLMDYMMAGKPVIHAVEAGNDIVAEAGCGISVPPENPAAVADAVIKMLDMKPAEREVMGDRGRRYVLAHHDYQVLAKRYLDYFFIRPI